ncbi:lipase family protein [Microbaculum marinum]|uniref:Fungal lipase-type domain-containing protein n=1 Tax=Microbaculum marinum TaxID=1764581 RepID=A0AAW9RS51_9HYPH
MQMRRSLFAAIALAGLVVLQTSHAEAACSNIRPTRPGEVYLFRGLANVFSRGMDQMAQHFTELGMENCVYNHSTWSGFANDVLERSYQNAVSYPIIIVGHSLGAGASPLMANYLGKNGIPVAYVTLFDPVEPTRVGENIAEVVNYYIKAPLKNKLVQPMAGFTGTIANIDMSGRRGIDHFTIDKNPELQNNVYTRALALSDTAAAETKKK